jgi:hypothetical protein
MAQVVVRRRRLDLGFIRRMTVTVDGTEVGELRPGARIVVELEPGRHELVASMDWYSGFPLNFEVGTNRIEVEVFLPRGFLTQMYKSADKHAQREITMSRIVT